MRNEPNDSNVEIENVLLALGRARLMILSAIIENRRLADFAQL
jgi:hypothetical protein